MLSKFVKSPNICDLLDDEKVKSIGEECKRGFDEE